MGSRLFLFGGGEKTENLGMSTRSALAAGKNSHESLESIAGIPQSEFDDIVRVVFHLFTTHLEFYDSSSSENKFSNWASKSGNDADDESVAHEETTT